MNNTRLGAAIIGTNHAHAVGHLRSLQRSEHFSLLAVAEPDAALASAARESSAWANVTWTDVDAVLADERVKLVCIETDPLDSLPYARRVVEAGKHVRIDKPPGADYAELERIYDEADRQHLFVQMAYIYRYQPAFRLAHRAVREGWLGQVRAATCQMNDLPGPEDRRKVDRYPGGQMFEICCHMIDALVWFLGKPARVSPILRHSDPVDDNLEDDVLAVFEFEPAVGIAKSTTRNRDRYFEILGESGGLRIHVSGPPQLQISLNAAHGEFTAGTQQVPTKSADGFLPDLADLANALHERRAIEHFGRDHDLAVQSALLTACGVR